MVSRLVMTVVELDSAPSAGSGASKTTTGLEEREAMPSQIRMRWPGHDAVAALEGGFCGERLAVEHGAVLAAEIDDSPVVAFALHEHVLAGEAGIVGVAERDGGGTAEADAIALERDHAVLAVGRENLKFFHAGILRIMAGRGCSFRRLQVGRNWITIRRANRISACQPRIGAPATSSLA